MITTKTAALICHSLAISPMFVGGLVYAIQNSYMSYHAAATNHSWHELSPGVQILFRAMLNGSGSLMLLTALTLILLLIIPFKQDQRWCFWAIPLIGISAMLITIRAAVEIDLMTPGDPPWEWLLLVIGLFISGLFLSLKNS
ncbi:hypothetical protein [Candidatus Colwellia aromaticivorans]|uniref:hypothetical protein n=1 Tax=Candidatus Colwellia aromaticivorans TaxID=2267621 RepID=UPI000DF4C1B3|nr:hypothetical protein [Candidatus Colwellia aromaticivorans]